MSPASSTWVLSKTKNRDMPAAISLFSNCNHKFNPPKNDRYSPRLLAGHLSGLSHLVITRSYRYQQLEWIEATWCQCWKYPEKKSEWWNKPRSCNIRPGPTCGQQHLTKADRLSFWVKRSRYVPEDGIDRSYLDNTYTKRMNWLRSIALVSQNKNGKAEE